jgi:hypothetical protein
MRRILVVAVGLVVLLSLSETTRAAEPGPLLVVSESTTVDPGTGDALFTLNLNRAPDFFVVDDHNRQRDDFQYYIDLDNGVPTQTTPDIIVRGPEIHIAGDIRIRDAFPSDFSDPNSGGWGKIRGSVPFTIDGSTLRFSVPLTMLGDQDGLFSYVLQMVNYGDQQQVIVGASVVLHATIGDLVSAFRSAVADGTITAPGPSGSHRLAVLTRMLNTALTAVGHQSMVCTRIRTVYRRLDGKPRPPDWITGPAKANLAHLAATVYNGELDCPGRAPL